MNGIDVCVEYCMHPNNFHSLTHIQPQNHTDLDKLCILKHFGFDCAFSLLGKQHKNIDCDEVTITFILLLDMYSIYLAFHFNHVCVLYEAVG